MYLHEDREQFADTVRKSVQHTNMSEMIIEKDYYVTMILKLLSQKLLSVIIICKTESKSIQGIFMTSISCYHLWRWMRISKG